MKIDEGIDLFDAANQRDVLKSILSSSDTSKTIHENIDILLTIIPEIEPMIGFEHQNPYHHLDVWEHTILAVSLAPDEEFDTRLALLLHDIGKPHSWSQDGDIRHFYGHGAVSEQISRAVLERLEFPKEYIDEMCVIIKNHDEPLTETDVMNNRDLSIKTFKVQICDCLAHNPNKYGKRLDYLANVTDMFNNIDLQKH